VKDYYGVLEVSAAKAKLLEDIEKLQLTLKTPHVASRRDGPNRFNNEVDDIFSLIQFVDENKLFDSLPIYVTDDPDHMPSMRLFDGDLSFIVKRLDKIEGRMDSVSSVLAAILHDIRSVHDTRTQAWKQTWPEPNAGRPTHSGVQLQSTTAVADGTTDTVNKPVSQPAGIGGSITVGKPGTVSLMSSKQASSNDSNDDQLFHPPGLKWSELSTKNRFADLANVDSDASDRSEPYTLVRGRRHFKRPRVDPSQQQQQQSNRQSTDNNQETKANTTTKPRRGPLLVGKAVPEFNMNTGNYRLMADAKVWNKIAKSTFYIDNVAQEYTEQDMRDFVATTMSIEVLSCFKVNARKRKTDDPTIERKAFRLCIKSCDRDRLLDASKWPDLVTVSDWYFKPPDPTRMKGINSTSRDLTRRSTSDTMSRLETSQQQQQQQPQQHDNATGVTAGYCDSADAATEHVVESISDENMDSSDKTVCSSDEFAECNNTSVNLTNNDGAGVV